MARILKFGREIIESCLQRVRDSLKPTRFEMVVLLIAAGMIVYQNFVPPLIGLADTGDFERLFPQSGLTHVATEYDDKYFLHFNSKYKVVPRTSQVGWYKSSSSLTMRAARWLSIRVGADQIFDIRILAALRGLILLFSLWLGLVAARSLRTSLRIILAALLILVFTDVGYAAYFNSFYSEPTALCFLAVCVGAAVVLISGRSSSVLFLLGYFLAAAMVVTSKPMYVPLAPVLVLLGIYLSGRVRHPWRFRLAGVLALGLCCTAAGYYYKTPRVLRVQMAYIGIFMDLLPHSSTPREDLAALGLNPDFSAFSGTTPYQADSPLNNPEFEAEFSSRTGSLTLPSFYLTRPGRFYELCARCVKHAFSTRLQRLGYYEAYTGKPPRAQAFGIWSLIREEMIPRSLLFLGFFFATGIAAVVFVITRRTAIERPMIVLYAVFILIAVVQFIVVVLTGGGEADAEKHLFMFNLVFDCCFVIWVVGGVYLLQTYGSSFVRIRTSTGTQPVEALSGVRGVPAMARSVLARSWKVLRPTRIELGVLVLVAGLIVYQNLVPPLIGLADSGDFERVIPQCGLAHVATEYKDKYFFHLNSKYWIIKRPGGPDWYKTSTSLLIRTARVFSIAVGQHQVFDIRVLAAVHLSLLLIGIWLILIGSRSLSLGLRVVLAGLLVLIFTDVGYVAYFNSFYSEGTAWCFLAIAIGSSLILIAGRSSSVLLGIGYFMGIVMVVTSKPQYIPLAPAFALFGVYLFTFVRSIWRNWICAGLSAGLCCTALWYYAETPATLRVQSAYVEIFMDLLPNSSTPQQDLAAMGLNPDFAAYSGTTPYQADTPMKDPAFASEFAAKSGSLTVPLFYLARPDRFYQLCSRCMKHTFTTRVTRLGYYEASTGKPPRAHPFGPWSAIRETVVPRSVFFLGFFLATGIAAAVFFLRRSSPPLRCLYLLYALFAFIALSQFLVGILAGGGEPDLEKHLFMFNLAFDVCLILFVLWVLDRIKRLRPAVMRSTTG